MTRFYVLSSGARNTSGTVPAISAPAGQAVASVAVLSEFAQRKRVWSLVFGTRAALSAATRVIQSACSAVALARITSTTQNLESGWEVIRDQPAVNSLTVTFAAEQRKPVCLPVAVDMIDSQVLGRSAAGASASVVIKDSVSDGRGPAKDCSVDTGSAPGAQAVWRAYGAVKVSDRQRVRPLVLRAGTAFQASRLDHRRSSDLRRGPEAHGARNTVSGPCAISLSGLSW